jgi:Ca-activated chloride channel family protein
MRSIAAFVLAAAALILTPSFVQAQNKPAKQRPPRPGELGSGTVLKRDPATGEIRRVPAKSAATPGAPQEISPEPGTIRRQVDLVEVGCNVLAPDGSSVRGLAESDFRLYEDGAAQAIAHFDASTEGASIVLVLDASPSIFRELAQMKSAARALAEKLSPADEVAVVSFSAEAHLLLPFSRDRAALEKALDSNALSRVEDSSTSNIYQAVYLAAAELFRGRTGRKAIVLLTDGEDSGLGLTWDPYSARPKTGRDADRLSFEDVARTLAAMGVELYAVSTASRPKAMTEDWLASHAAAMLVSDNTRELHIPAYTAYLAELVRRAGGRIYFLREIGTLTDVYRRIAETLSAQYTLGFYSSAPVAHPGWHTLRVEVMDRAGVRAIHRGSYYIPAGR